MRVICLDLPEAHEEQAWAGVRWNIGKKNFAHLVALDGGWPPAYVQAARIDTGVVVNDGTDWDEIEVLVRMSYRVLAPKRLAAQAAE